MEKYTIYLRRNTINGKCYVGQTKDFKRMESEWRCLKLPYSKHIDVDRAKYGLDNFTVEVLAEVDTREEAWELEQRFIRDYKTLWPNGYNISKGGSGYNGVCPSNETRRKLSESHKGKHHSDETRQKISEANKSKQFNREDQSKQVYQYTLDSKLVQVWPSTQECGRNKFNSGNVASCCRGEQKTHKGYIWSYQPLN